MNKSKKWLVSLCAAVALSFSPVTLRAAEETSTNTEPTLYKTVDEQKNALSAYPSVIRAGFDANQSQTDQGTYVIPGLIKTQTLDKTGKVAECDEMTPQGVTIADDYILISAYCHKHEHNTVLYVLSRDDHKYLKTIVLENRPHAGSIAYDTLNRNVWIATKDEKTKKGSVSFIKLANMDNYDFEHDHKALKYDYSIETPQLKDDSFLTYADSKLYCGYFTKDEGSVKVYDFDIDPASGKLDTTRRHVAKAYGYDNIGDNCQGIAMDDHFIYLAASDGPSMQSTLSVFKRGETSLLNSNAQKIITLPPRLEQIYPDGNGGLLTLYESAASAYRNEGSDHIDRILTMNIQDMLASK